MFSALFNRLAIPQKMPNFGITNNTEHMKRLFLAAAFLFFAVAANAQQALGPGTGLVSPEINPDNSVTFRYHNPKAKVVQITGDFLPTRPISPGRHGALS